MTLPDHHHNAAGDADTASNKLTLSSPDAAPAKERWLWGGVIVLFVLVAYGPAMQAGSSGMMAATWRRTVCCDRARACGTSG